MTPNRRQFLTALSGITSTSLLTNNTSLLANAVAAPLHIACNSYTWNTFYGREKKEWMADPDASLSDFVASGLTSYEPSMTKVEDATKLAPYLKKYKLEMRSIYVNSSLHDPNDAQQSIDTALAIASSRRRRRSTSSSDSGRFASSASCSATSVANFTSAKLRMIIDVL